MNPPSTRMAAWIEQAWLDRYLERRLTEEEAAWFEAYLMDKPDLLATVEADTALRDALSGAADAGREPGADGDAGGFSGGPPRNGAIGPKRSRSRWPGPAWMALAASLIVGIGVGWQVKRSAESPRLDVIANPTRIVFDTMRGTTQAPDIERPDSTAPYVLVEVATPPGAQSVRLRIGDSPERALIPSPDGFVSFLVARSEVDGGARAEIRYAVSGKEVMRSLALRRKE